MLEQAIRDRAAIHAAVRLLVDEHPGVVRMCRTQLLAWGESAREELIAASESEHARLRVRARALITSLDLRAWLEGFSSRITTDRGADGDNLLEVALEKLVEFVGHVHGDRAAFAAILESIAADLRAHVNGRGSRCAARRIAELFTSRFELRGSRRLPKDRLAWLPDRVLASGQGPSSVLAALYLVIGRRAGLTLTPVLLPEFILIRIHGARRILIDPYHNGRTVTRHDCFRFLLRRERLGVGQSRRSLDDADDAEVLDRVLEDLILIHDRPEHGEVRDILRAARAALEPAYGRLFG